MSSSTNEQINVAPSPQVSSSPVGLSDKIKKVLSADPHRAYTAGDLMRALKLQSPKDLEKEAKTLGDIASSLLSLKEDGLLREVALNVFKVRLFFDPEKNIEQAFIGGMGNTRYSFNSSIFRLNIGVLSLYFFKNEKARSWRVYVSDATIGKDYSLVRPLCEGVHCFGTDPVAGDGKMAWVIDGKYIDKTHTTVVLSQDKIDVEDHCTLRGTRVDHMTDQGFARYAEAAYDFLKSVGESDVRDVVKRGRFVLDQLLHHHKNYETSFFNTVLDFVLVRDANLSKKAEASG